MTPAALAEKSEPPQQEPLMHAAAPPPQKRESSDDRRVAIALAAQALIVEKGVEGLRTRDIAERVGINVATLHYHVPSKEALLELVADHMRQEFMDQHLTRPRKHLSAAERMDLEFVDFREMVEKKPHLLAALSELMERGRRDERIMAAVRPLQQKWRAQVTELLRAARDEGALRPDIDPEPCAIMLIGALLAFCRSGQSMDDYDSYIAELRRAIRHPNPPSKE
jgi:AcrR family transcriptional regulator